jgi:acyl dehydratase
MSPSPIDRYEVVAFNTATASTNKIHDDTVARNLGFSGGLVPGVDVFAYLTHLPAARWGRPWLDGGAISARFHSPVYDGDTVEVIAEPVEGTPMDDALDLTLFDSKGLGCAVAVALREAPDEAPPLDLIPAAERRAPEDLPAASPGAFAAFPDGVLGTLEYGFHVGEVADRYLADVRETLPLYRADGVAHPGWLLRMANWALSNNVRLGPWIHVGSSLQLYGAITDGSTVSVRSRVTDVSDRKGHGFVDLDVLYVVDEERVAAFCRHTAIYEPRGVRSTASG